MFYQFPWIFRLFIGDPDPRSHHVASSTMVPGTLVSLPRSSTKSLHRPKITPSAKVRDPSRKSPGPRPSRMASVRQALSSLGASDDTQDMVLLQHRAGTSNVYSSAWTKWCEWCDSKKFNPLKPLSIHLANYLSHLFKERNLSASTVKVHRAAVSSTLRQLGGPSFSDEPLLSAVVDQPSFRRPRVPSALRLGISF